MYKLKQKVHSLYQGCSGVARRSADENQEVSVHYEVNLESEDYEQLGNIVLRKNTASSNENRTIISYVLLLTLHYLV